MNWIAFVIVWGLAMTVLLIVTVVLDNHWNNKIEKRREQERTRLLGELFGDGDTDE